MGWAGVDGVGWAGLATRGGLSARATLASGPWLREWPMAARVAHHGRSVVKDRDAPRTAAGMRRHREREGCAGTESERDAPALSRRGAGPRCLALRRSYPQSRAPAFVCGRVCGRDASCVSVCGRDASCVCGRDAGARRWGPAGLALTPPSRLHRPRAYTALALTPPSRLHRPRAYTAHVLTPPSRLHRPRAADVQGELRETARGRGALASPCPQSRVPVFLRVVKAACVRGRRTWRALRGRWRRGRRGSCALTTPWTVTPCAPRRCCRSLA